MKKKVIIFSAPSGSGKSTIVNYLLAKDFGLEFSVSATCRAPRGEEKHGKEYYFFSTDEFKERIEAEDFLEWEEVYPGCFYGTLKSELERIWKAGHAVVFDVDVVMRRSALRLCTVPGCREIRGGTGDSAERPDRRPNGDRGDFL